MSITPRDLRNHYGDLLARVEAGESFDVVRDGRIVATLGPPRRPAGTPRGRFAEIFRASASVDVERFFEDLYGSDSMDDTFGDPLRRQADDRSSSVCSTPPS
jgi:antitoxin (DNA-binding transcriptional repressor) of toxin-antitoxin stability system